MSNEDELQTGENAKAKLTIAQINEYLHSLPDVVTKDELVKTINDNIGDSLKNHLTVMSSLMEVQNSQLTKNITGLLDRSEKHIKVENQKLRDDVDDIEKVVRGVARTANENHGAVSLYLENQETLNKNLNDLIAKIGEMNTTLNDTNKTLTTSARLGEAPTVIDRIHDLEITTRVDFQPRIQRLEEGNAEVIELSKKFKMWEENAGLITKILTKISFVYSTRKTRISLVFKKLWSRVVKTASEQIFIRLILYVGAGVLGTGMLAEVAAFIETTQLGSFVSELIIAVLGG
jgi:hypothetical protein